MIGATATITEAITGLPFPAQDRHRGDDLLDSRDEVGDRGPFAEAVGKRGQADSLPDQNEKGDKAWIETVIAGRVRVRSSVQREDDYHGRYKVRLPLEWNGVKRKCWSRLTTAPRWSIRFVDRAELL